MKHIFGGKRMLIYLAVVLLIAALFIVYQQQGRSKRVSEFGKYQGYTQPIYDGTQRTSEYLTLSDGTRLAYDLIIPTKKGKPAGEPLPVLFKYTPYGRAWTVFDKKGNFLLDKLEELDWPSKAMLRVRYLLMGERGRILDPLFRDGWLEKVVQHGYIVVSVDRPGTGASFPSPTPGSMETATIFENEILNWIAAQPWSDGNIGMYGDSQQAMVQFTAAAAGNPHLKAILPAASQMEIYEAVEYPGGVYNVAFANLYDRMVPLLDNLVTPVDSDPDGILLAQALEERRGKTTSQSITQIAVQCPYRESATADGVKPWETMALYPFAERINRSNTAVYLVVGWYDIFTADMFYWYNNLEVPRRLTVRPTDHSQVSANQKDLDFGVEALRWFDYWLKGIDNGIMNEPPIHYYLQEGSGQGTWQTASQWPLKNMVPAAYYFGPGKSGTVPSANDGMLTREFPAAANAVDRYTIDYTTTTGTQTRWSAVEEVHVYPDLRARDAKALTYTTAPLAGDMVITGHPVAHIWLATSAPDLDVFAYLEVVDRQGKSTYLTEGVLRASHRKLGQAPFDTLGLPYHTHFQRDALSIPSGEPVELAFSLLPTAYRFPAGSRVRITIAFTDAGNFGTPVLDPAPTLQILRDPAHPSYVELPGQ